MGFVVGGTLVTAGLLIALGVSILRCGDPRLVVESGGRSQEPRLKPEARRANGLLYIVCGLASLAVLVITVTRGGRQFAGWLQSNFMGLLGGLFLLSYGFMAILRPSIVIGWLETSYHEPDLAAHNPWLPSLVRGLGAFLAILSLILLKSLR